MSILLVQPPFAPRFPHLRPYMAVVFDDPAGRYGSGYRREIPTSLPVSLASAHTPIP